LPVSHSAHRLSAHHGRSGKRKAPLTIKRAGYVVGGFAAAILVLLGLPALIQWDGYKDRIAAAAQARLGRKLDIAGSLNLALLPLPHVSAHDVRLADADGAAQPEMMTARVLELRPSLLGLLSGRFEVAAVRLSQAELHLQRLADGKANWQFQPAPKAAPAASSDVPASDRAAEHRAAAMPSILLDDASITYQAGGGHPLRLDGVTAALSQPDAQTSRFAAKGVVHGALLTADGVLSGDQLDVTLGLGAKAAEARFKGRFSTQDGFKGQVQAKGDSLHDVAVALGANGLRLPQGGLLLTGELTLDAHALRFDKASLFVAGTEGIASVDADFGHGPQFDVALAFSHMDLDRWAASLPAPTLRQTPVAAVPTVPEGPSAVAAPKAGGGFSKALAVNLDVSADSLTLHGGELHQARFNAALADGELLVNQAGVELPGQSEVNLFGFFTPADDGLSFDGTLEGRSGEMRGLLAWLGLPPVHLAQDRLRQGSFTGHVQADAKAVRLDEGVLKLDGAKADLAADLKLAGRPALGVSFAVDHLNLDAYRADHVAHPGDNPPPSDAAPPKAEGAMPPPAAERDSWLEGLDANVKGKVGSLTAYGLTAQDLSLDAAWLNGVLTLNKFTSADVDGAQLNLGGGIDPLGLAFHHFRWEVRTDHPAKLLKALISHLPVEPERLAPLALTGTLDGRLNDKLDLDSRNEIAGGQLELTGRIDQPLGDPGLHLSLAASHASLTQVIRLFSPDYRPQASLGAFAASTTIAGPVKDLAFSDLRLKLGPAAAAGDAHLTHSGARPRLDLKLTAGEIAVDPFLPTKRTGDARPSLREQIESGLLIPTKGVPAHRSGGGDLPPAPASAPRPKVTVSGLSDHWSSDPMDLSWLTALDGHAVIDAQAVTWNQSRLDQASLLLDVQDGSAKLEQLTGKLWGGEMALSGALADNGAMKMDGKLSHAQMREALLSTAGLGMADGVMDGETSLTAKGKSVNEMVSHLNGTLQVAAVNGLVKGFDLKAVDDKAKDLNNPLGLINLLQAGLTGGSTRFSSLNGSAKIKDGILVCDDLALTADGGGAKGQVTANLPGWVMDAHAAFHLASSPEAPPLVMRLTGPLDNPRRFLDINAMQTWLAQKGVGLKGPMKDAADALGKMLNGERKEDGGKVKAKDVVKSLFKGLK